MNKNFEEHIRKNKSAFDEFEPSEALWHRIERDLAVPPARVVRFPFIKYAAAAAIAGLLLLSGWLLFTRDAGVKPGNELSSVESVTTDSNSKSQDSFLAVDRGIDSPMRIQDFEPAVKSPINEKKADKYLVNQVETDQIIESYKSRINDQYKLLAVLKENEPLLYKKFTYDLQELDSNFHVLKVKSRKVLNNEQLINAMIDNLQLQTELLQKQLYIIQTLKREKNEQDYKTL